MVILYFWQIRICATKIIRTLDQNEQISLDLWKFANTHNDRNTILMKWVKNKKITQTIQKVNFITRNNQKSIQKLF